MILKTLESVGLSQKEAYVYMSSLQIGPSPVRKIAESAGINRGTTYDILKSLQEKGLVSYYHKDKNQYFIAENPQRLQEYVKIRKQELDGVKSKLTEIMPELKSVHNDATTKPVVKYFEGDLGVVTVLKDVIETCSASMRHYYAFSSSIVKGYLYKAYKDFNKDRIKNSISVQTISIGPGGETAGLDERKWLTEKEGSPAYILIYENKVAQISVNASGEPFGIIMEDKNIYETQKLLFEHIWKTLE
ncbi:MAG: helix-turn-helix domain-containing protein [bacterium]